MLSTITDTIKTLPFYLLPQHGLSALMHRFMRIKTVWVKNTQINIIAKLFKVNLKEAVHEDINAYQCFNDFFTRQLKPQARKITVDDKKMISPVDGAISQFGPIVKGELFQAKGQHYSLLKLLGGKTELSEQFIGGDFITIYLSPKDYHRVHMPVQGKLQKMIHVPGDLFSVNNASVKTIPDLFARNERVINIFQTPHGLMALIQVGAIFVSSIETIWHGEVTPPRRLETTEFAYDGSDEFNQGEEMGRFNMGSTVILLFEKDRLKFSQHLKPDLPLQLGQISGSFND